jgi:hypothetical protein
VRRIDGHSEDFLFVGGRAEWHQIISYFFVVSMSV